MAGRRGIRSGLAAAGVALAAAACGASALVAGFGGLPKTGPMSVRWSEPLSPA